MTDRELLARYVQSGSEAAFAEIRLQANERVHLE